MGSAQHGSPGFTIREAQPADAGQLVTHMQRVLAEPGIALIAEADEFSLTVDGQRHLLAQRAAGDNSTTLVAEAGGQLIGEITCRGDARRAKRHVGLIGITVAQEWRDQGVGSALLAGVIAWAKATHVITRLELLVFAENARAVHVYQKLGFTVEGVKRRAIFKQGRYHDENLMALLLPDPSGEP